MNSPKTLKKKFKEKVQKQVQDDLLVLKALAIRQQSAVVTER
jgi:hypothetical protein